MQENNPSQQEEDFLKNLPVRSEEIGFQPDEMTVCGKCARKNAPNRIKCLYCGAELEISPANAGLIKPVLRKLEHWENGFNLIYLPGDAPLPDEAVEPIATSIGLAKESLQKISESRRPLPIVRCETLQEAKILQDRLRESHLQSFVVADEALTPDAAPKRLRGLEFLDDKILLVLFNNDRVEEIGIAELNLIVTGAIFQKSIEATEARKKGESKILDATETASDEDLIDIYTKDDPVGYRILTKGFDFSCLGAEKGILARENIKRLVVKLRSLAPHASLVDNYLSIRSLLGEVWEIEQRRDSQGLARQRFGKFDLSSVSSSTNSRQFTKYSRLQRHLISR